MVLSGAESWYVIQQQAWRIQQQKQAALTREISKNTEGRPIGVCSSIKEDTDEVR